MLTAAVVATAAVGATLPASGVAEDAADLQRQADALRAENQGLAAGSQSAVSDLVGLPPV